jgi:hypothetical protein
MHQNQYPIPSPYNACGPANTPGNMHMFPHMMPMIMPMPIPMPYFLPDPHPLSVHPPCKQTIHASQPTMHDVVRKLSFQMSELKQELLQLNNQNEKSIQKKENENSNSLNNNRSKYIAPRFMKKDHKQPDVNSEDLSQRLVLNIAQSNEYVINDVEISQTLNNMNSTQQKKTDKILSDPKTSQTEIKESTSPQMDMVVKTAEIKQHVNENIQNIQKDEDKEKMNDGTTTNEEHNRLPQAANGPKPDITNEIVASSSSSHHFLEKVASQRINC